MNTRPLIPKSKVFHILQLHSPFSLIQIPRVEFARNQPISGYIQSRTSTRSHFLSEQRYSSGYFRPRIMQFLRNASHRRFRTHSAERSSPHATPRLSFKHPKLPREYRPVRYPVRIDRRLTPAASRRLISDQSRRRRLAISGVQARNSRDVSVLTTPAAIRAPRVT